MCAVTAFWPRCEHLKCQAVFFPSASSYENLISPSSGCFGKPKIDRPPTIAFIAAPGLSGVSAQTTRIKKFWQRGSFMMTDMGDSIGRDTCSAPFRVTKVLYHDS